MLTPAEFRDMHRPGDPFVLPNAWDLASARWLHAAGNPVVGTTSLGVAVVAGLPDGAGLTAAETLGLAERLTAASIPVTVDLEAGFSDDPEVVGAFAARLARLGVVGVNIEDSDVDGRLVDPDRAAAKVAAIAASAPALYLNARTDAFWIGGDADATERHAEAVARARRYLDAGASGVFVPGAIALDGIAALTGDIPAPVNVLVQPGVTLRQLADAGVARVSTGSLLFRVALGAIDAAVHEVRDGAFTPDAWTPSLRDDRRTALRTFDGPTGKPALGRCRRGIRSLGVACAAGLDPHGLTRHLREVGRERQLAEAGVEVALPPRRGGCRCGPDRTACPPRGRRARAGGRAPCGS